jgi:hypothetical protein
MGIFPKALGVFVDFSVPMLDAAWKNLNGSSLARVIKADFGNPDCRFLEVGKPNRRNWYCNTK